MTEASVGSKRAEKLLDLGVFAPVGFVLQCRRLLPELAEHGRKQVAFSRSLGRAALKTLAARPPGNTAGRAAASPVADSAGAEASSSPDVAGEIAGYQGLTAREIIALVDACQVPQLDWIERSEKAGKARVTVLRAVQRRRTQLGGD